MERFKMNHPIFKSNLQSDINSRIRNIQPAFSVKSKQDGFSPFLVYILSAFLIGGILYALFYLKPTIITIYLVALAISIAVGQIFGLILYLGNAQVDMAGQKPVFGMKRLARQSSIKKGWYFAVIFFIFLVLQINFDII